MVKDNVKGTILVSADSVESRMSSIAKNEIFFRSYFSVADVCKRIDEVRPEDLRRVARKLLGTGKRGILAVGPRPSKKVRQLLRPKRLKR